VASSLPISEIARGRLFSFLPARDPAEDSPVAKDSLTITDNRTGKTYELPITEGTIKAPDLRNIKLDAEDFGLMTYDPAFLNTACLPQRHHLHRRRPRHPEISRLSHRADRREGKLFGSRLSAL
jgi:hypothetical protein